MVERTQKAWRNLPWAEVLAVATLLGLAGYLMAWVPHPAPALRIAGLDLGEYVKFLPEVRAGEVRVQRELFYLPLLAGALALPLAAWSMGGAWRWPARALAFPLAAVAALLMLPPVWTPQTLFRGEFQKQGVAIALSLLATALSPLLLLPAVRRAAAALVAFLDMLAAVWPPIQFFAVKPALEKVYASALPTGAGVWLCLGGFLLAGLSSLALCLASQGPKEKHPPERKER